MGLYIDEWCNEGQEHDLNHDFSNSVNVTKENLEGLEKTGQQLLQEKVVKMNLDTFNLEEFGETNAEALDRWKKKNTNDLLIYLIINFTCISKFIHEF